MDLDVSTEEIDLLDELRRFSGLLGKHVEDILAGHRPITLPHVVLLAKRRVDLAVAQIEHLGTALEAAERDRDLAIAHDRQPYPTAWAYERACEALHEHRERADKAEAERDRLAAQVAQLEADLAKVQWAPRDMDGEP